ncbi:MAG: hypothetical protein ACK58T_00200, partial [Phycisphaerae bacterium]
MRFSNSERGAERRPTLILVTSQICHLIQYGFSVATFSDFRDQGFQDPAELPATFVCDSNN